MNISNIILERLLSDQYTNNITFPIREHQNIKNELNKGNTVSTVRLCNEYNKYKKGQTYKTQWGDIIRITSVRKFTNPQQIPTWNSMDTIMKTEIIKWSNRCDNKIDWVRFKKVV